ncbi:unnamed protein product [Rhodiola kirilowii]
MVQNNQFAGQMNEDPHQHLKRFTQMLHTMKTNGVPPESYYFRMFPFSLSDKASRWLDSHAEGTFTTWNKLAEAFIQQYFPPWKTAHFRNKIISFRSIDGETLYDSWERYKELTRMCPHYNLVLWQIIDTFYQGIDQGMRTLINQAAGGGLNGVPLEDAYGIIERAAQDYHLWTSDRGNPKDRKGVQDLCQAESTNDIARLTDTVKLLATEIQNMKVGSNMKSSDVANISVYCQICGSPSHYVDGCPVIGSNDNSGNQEDANFVGQNNQGTGFGNGSAGNRWDNQTEITLTSRTNHRIKHLRVSHTNSNKAVHHTNHEDNTTFRLSKHRITLPTSRSLSTTISHKGSKIRIQGATTANSATREHGKLTSKQEHNTRESVNAITLRGGKQLEMIPAQATRATAEKSALDSAPADEETSKEAEERGGNSARKVEPAPYKPPIPFPQRLKGARRDKELMKFVDKIHTLYITIPFTDAITQIPTYAKFMKEIMTGERKMDDTETVALSEECSAAMHLPMPPKLKDSGSFSIPCYIGGLTIRRALCDLGASVSIMPYYLYAKLNLGDLYPTNISICLADRSCRLPKGILKDVPVRVKNIYIPADFIVLEISEDTDIPIILGRPFLYTARVVIDMNRGSIAL